MKTFTIENDTNNITVYGSAKEAEAVPNSERFGTEGALGKLAANWPAARLVEIYNSLPGVTEVKKFKDRATAVSRIWKAIQTLGQAEASPIAEPENTPEQTPKRSRKQLFLTTWTPPLLPTLRHRRPTPRRKWLPRRRRWLAPRERPNPPRSPVLRARAARPAR